jgi:hypothetical protein
VKALGEREPPLALKMPNGECLYPITDYADLSNALAAYKDQQFDNFAGLVRAWIVERAIKLGLIERLPKGLAEPKCKPHPNEVARLVGTTEAGGPTGAGGSTGGGVTGGTI